MSGLLLNERRSPRLPLRMRAEVAGPGSIWTLETMDVGPRGCLLVSGRQLAPQRRLRLTLRSPLLPNELGIAARVAWAAPPHAGLEFVGSNGEHTDPRAWFERLLISAPRLRHLLSRAPAAVDLDAPVHLCPPPRLLDLGPDEIALVLQVESGSTVRDLFARANVPKNTAVRALFALLENGVLTLTPTGFDAGSSWRALIAEAHARPEPSEITVLAKIPLASKPEARPASPPRVPPPTSAAVRPQGPSPIAGRAPCEATDSALLRGATASERSSRAERLFEEARAAAAVGKAATAIPILRQALALAPRDKEIAKLLGMIAFGERTDPRGKG